MFYRKTLRAIREQQNKIFCLLNSVASSNLQILKNQEKIMGDLTSLQAAVTKEETVEASVVTLLQQLSAAIAALPVNDQAAIDALAAQVNADSATLAAAVTANTPAAPASQGDGSGV